MERLPKAGRLILVADVGLDSRSAGSDAIYTYEAQAGTEPGQAWFVPLGPRLALGYVLSVRQVFESELGFPAPKLRSLGHRVHGLELPDQLMQLLHQVAEDCLATPSDTLTLAVPPGVKEKIVTRWSLASDPPPREDLTPAMKEVLRGLQEGPITEAKGSAVPKPIKSSLSALAARRQVDQEVALAAWSSRRTLGGLLRLTPDLDAIERFLAGPGRKRPAQAVTLMRLQGSESASFSIEEIKALGGVTDQTIKALISAGLIQQVESETGTLQPPHQANPHQTAAIEAVSAAIRAREPRSFLLYGVTGSGKTEVYLRAAAEALKDGRQVLYLVPEIALTAQVIAQLRARFGRSVAVLHSSLSPQERLENWMRVRFGEAPVALGPRSALFAPFRNLGLIVMDEEHEASYKQENSPRHHAKEVAQRLAALHGCPLLMGSATPSVESFQLAMSGSHELLRLPQRAAAKAQMPEVILEDLRVGYKTRRPSIFSATLEGLMRETLDRKEQVILFLNRRAYAPFLLCRECGHKWTCPSCAVTFSFHRRENRLKCHHCDRQMAPPTICPQCGSEKLKPFGVGAEKVEEEVASQFPEARVARLDRDVARRQGALEEILARFRSRELDILVGTQMVAKGLDFPHVTLVGVIAADLSLGIPDFRASERTFQLLSQVAGRAGRGERPGKVVIQTLNPEHPAIVAAQSHDYETLFRDLIEERRAAKYPPFVELVNILCHGPDRDAVVGLSVLAAQRLRRELPGAEVLGPVDCALERLNTLWRRHLLVKLPLGDDPRPIRTALAGLQDSKARLVVDVNPYNLV